jgi:ethanolamine ammonia-lyase large subunit
VEIENSVEEAMEREKPFENIFEKISGTEKTNNEKKGENSVEQEKTKRKTQWNKKTKGRTN